MEGFLTKIRASGAMRSPWRILSRGMKDQIFLFGKITLARAKRGMIGDKNEAAKKDIKNVFRLMVLKLFDCSMLQWDLKP